MGHSSVSTTQKFYNQVDRDHRENAAAVIDLLISGVNSKNDKPAKTDAKMTPRTHFEQVQNIAQA
jgi:hypothetical protein